MIVPMDSVYLKSLSCNTGSVFLARLEERLNRVEGLRLEIPSRTFFGNVLPHHFADVRQAAACRICVIDGCAVMEYIHRDVLEYICQIRELNPAIKIMLTGCAAAYAVKSGMLPAGIDGATDQVEDVCVFIGRALGLPAGGAAAVQPMEEVVADPRARGVLVRWGCDHRCAYCIVPHVRAGLSGARDVSAARILQALKSMDGLKADPVMLSGVCVSSWRGSINGKAGTFDDLLALILRATTVRIEKLSLQPKDITPETLRLICHDRVLRPWMIAVQHFSDRILQGMGRQYDARRVAAIFDGLLADGVTCGVITDFIVGFPGETEEDLLALDVFIRRYKTVLARVKVIAYCDRSLTLAAAMPGQIPKAVKKERVRIVAERCRCQGVPCEELVI